VEVCAQARITSERSSPPLALDTHGRGRHLAKLHVAPIRVTSSTRKEDTMSTYVSLLRFTDQGIRNIKDSPTRLDAAKKAFQAAGGELKQFFLLMGKYDALIIAELPNDETAGKVTLALGSLGNVRTESFKAFTEPEYRKVIAGLP
jgi:uncharacterized protein with GYD domain